MTPIAIQPCPVCGNPDGCPTCTHGSRCGQPDCPVCNPVRRRLHEVEREIDQIERQMHEEAGMLSGDPRVLRLRALWAEEDALEDVLYGRQ